MEDQKGILTLLNPSNPNDLVKVIQRPANSVKDLKGTLTEDPLTL